MRVLNILARWAPWGLAVVQGWLIDRLLRQHGRTLLAQDELSERLQKVEQGVEQIANRRGVAVEGGAPDGNDQAITDVSTTSDPSRAYQAIQYTRYRRMQDEAIRSAPPYPWGRFTGAGIVMLAGGPRYYTNAWVCLTMLRRVLGCRLPIQVWYLGPDEMSPRMIELLQPFDVECVDALEVRRHYPTRTVGGWELKAYAILHCPFKDVIFLDADNVPLVDPAALLNRAEYRATGAIFWPDLGSLSRDAAIWKICRVSYRDEPEWETGQVVVDKERCWKALQLVQHLNERSDFYYQHVNGDKETFHMAWRMLDHPFSMPPYRPQWITGRISPNDTQFADALHQHDFDGQIIFQHRTGAKWTAWGQNLRIPGFQFEDACLKALRDLRQQWDGTVDVVGPAADATDGEAAIMGARYFLYRRIGSDERVLALLPGGRIGDGKSQWEQAWRLEQKDGCPVLIIEGHDSITCRLERAPDGAWRGRWLHSEQMPVELVPLGASPSVSRQKRNHDRASLYHQQQSDC